MTNMIAMSMTNVVGKSRGLKSLRGRFSSQYIRAARQTPEISAAVENRASGESDISSFIDDRLTGGKPPSMRSLTLRALGPIFYGLTDESS